MEWRKSSYSGDTGSCVQVSAYDSGHIAIRDSKDPASPVLALSYAAWREFLDRVRTLP